MLKMSVCVLLNVSTTDRLLLPLHNLNEQTKRWLPFPEWYSERRPALFYLFGAKAMIGVKGVPFTESFEWVRWSRSVKELKRAGATEVLTDDEAKRRGYVVAAAKAEASRGSK